MGRAGEGQNGQQGGHPPVHSFKPQAPAWPWKTSTATLRTYIAKTRPLPDHFFSIGTGSFAAVGFNYGGSSEAAGAAAGSDGNDSSSSSDSDSSSSSDSEPDDGLDADARQELEDDRIDDIAGEGRQRRQSGLPHTVGCVFCAAMDANGMLPCPSGWHLLTPWELRFVGPRQMCVCIAVSALRRAYSVMPPMLPPAEQFGLNDFSFRLHKALAQEGEEEARMRKPPRQVARRGAPARPVRPPPCPGFAPLVPTV